MNANNHYHSKRSVEKYQSPKYGNKINLTSRMEFDELNTLETMENETPAVTMANTNSNKEDPEAQQRYKLLLTLWLSVCLIGFVWFVNKVMRGRQRIRYNFNSIEEQLRRMQAAIDERERAEAENASLDTNTNENTEELKGDEPKVPSPDAQELLERITKTYEEENEDMLENLEEKDELDAILQVEMEKPQENSEINGNVDTETINNRRRKFIDGIESKIDRNNVELIRDTIEDIIQEGDKEIVITPPSSDDKKDN